MKLYLIENRLIEADLDPEMFSYKPLSAKQYKFFKDNPTASVQEVLDCKLVVPYVPTLEESIKFKVDAFSREAFESRERILPEYKITNCALGIYDTNTTEQIRNTVNSFRNEFYRLKTLCEACASIEELNAVHSDYGSITINI